MFDILPLQEDSKRERTISKSIPQPVFRTLICASSGSGKTTLLIRLLCEYKKEIHKVVIFTPNVSQFIKKEFVECMDSHDMMYEDFDEDTVRHHFKKQYKRNRDKTKIKKECIFVFDDTIDFIKKNMFFKELFLISRKEGISLIFTAHKFSFVPLLIRQNLTHMVLLSTNRRELNNIAEYTSKTGQELMDLWKSRQGRFDFLYFNFTNGKIVVNFV